MPLAYQQVSSPSVEPVSVTLAKQHLRIDFDDDDTYISALITAARQYVEHKCNLALFNRSMLFTCDYFPWPGWGYSTAPTSREYWIQNYYRGMCFRMPFPRLVSVESIRYTNDGTNWTTIDPSRYVLDTVSEPGRISPYPGYTWPYQEQYIPGGVEIKYTAGTFELPVAPETFTVPSAAPYTLSQAAKLVTLTSVLNGTTPVACQNSAGVLTFDPSLAGQTLIANYTINDCPQPIIFAMLMLMSHWYKNRDDVTELNLKATPRAVDAMLAPYRRMTLW